MVAAEFWEQGDLERTVLEQQPIVRLLQLCCVLHFSCNIVTWLSPSFHLANDGQEPCRRAAEDAVRLHRLCLLLRVQGELVQQFIRLRGFVDCCIRHSVCALAGVCPIPRGDKPHVHGTKHQPWRVEGARRRPRSQDEGHWGREEEAGRRRHTRWAARLRAASSQRLLHCPPPGHSFFLILLSCRARWRKVKDLRYLINLLDCWGNHKWLSGSVCAERAFFDVMVQHKWWQCLQKKKKSKKQTLFL